MGRVEGAMGAKSATKWKRCRKGAMVYEESKQQEAYHVTMSRLLGEGPMFDGRHGALCHWMTMETQQPHRFPWTTEWNDVVYATQKRWKLSHRVHLMAEARLSGDVTTYHVYLQYKCSESMDETGAKDAIQRMLKFIAMPEKNV